MATRLLIAVALGATLVLPALGCAARNPRPDRTPHVSPALLSGPSRLQKDAIRDRAMHRVGQRPLHVTSSPDVARIKKRMRQPVTIEQPRKPPRQDQNTRVQLFFPPGATLATVIATLAHSLGYSYRFVAQRDKQITIGEPLRGPVRLDDAVGWLSERAQRRIVVYDESRLIMIYHGDFQ